MRSGLLLRLFVKESARLDKGSFYSSRLLLQRSVDQSIYCI